MPAKMTEDQAEREQLRRENHALINENNILRAAAKDLHRVLDRAGIIERFNGKGQLSLLDRVRLLVRDRDKLQGDVSQYQEVFDLLHKILDSEEIPRTDINGKDEPLIERVRRLVMVKDNFNHYSSAIENENKRLIAQIEALKAGQHE